MTPDDEIQVESLDYLRHLATLADEPDEDPACLCCAWAVGDIISLRKHCVYSVKLIFAADQQVCRQAALPIRAARWTRGGARQTKH